MERDSVIPEHGALLVVEIGADLTRATLVDIVDGSYRLIARAVSPSTFTSPENDPTRAIVAALRQIEATTSRELVRNDQVIVPQDAMGNGVDGVVATTSAAGPLSVVVAGPPQDAALQSATHAARSTYTTLRGGITLDANGVQPGQQLGTLTEIKPDVMIMAGAFEDAAAESAIKLAQIVGLMARHTGYQPLVIFAGNSAIGEQVRTTIGDATTVEVIENMRPLPNQVRIEPTRGALRRYYREHRVAAMPGADRLAAMHIERLGSIVEDQGLMVRFLAQRYDRNVLAIGVDAVTTACLLSSGGHYSEAIFGRLGVREGAAAVMKERGAANIQRWLPFGIEETALNNRLLNRLLRPRQVPADLDDLLLDYALIREAAATAYTALRDERPDASYDLVIASGSLVDAPRTGLAALALLDALQPTSKDSELAINLYLDQFSLLAASGALAHLDADAAACLLELDALNNTPLATVIVPRGELTPGKKIADVELMPLHDTPLTATVTAGEIVRLPLPRGKRATLRIRPVGSIAIGQNQPGTEVLSDEAAIVGSALGVIIDARPRPLTLPNDLERRRAVLLRWMEALDALPPITAFAPSAAADAPAATSHDSIGEAPSSVVASPTDDLAAVGTSSAVDDMATLREGLRIEPQQKRGLFRRK